MEDSCCCLPGQQALRFVLLLLLLPTLIAGGDMQDLVAKRAFRCAGQFREEFTDNPGTEHRNRFRVIGLDVAVDIPQIYVSYPLPVSQFYWCPLPVSQFYWCPLPVSQFYWCPHLLSQFYWCSLLLSQFYWCPSF